MSNYTPKEKNLKDLINDLFYYLKDREEKLVYYIYELGGSQREIAKRVDLSNSRIQQKYPLPAHLRKRGGKK